LAQRRVDIYERFVALAQRQLKEIEHRIRVGDLPETELAAARAESASARGVDQRARRSGDGLPAFAPFD
jgi:outer membrane protein TolC